MGKIGALENVDQVSNVQIFWLLPQEGGLADVKKLLS
jgi:hypothetical protein